MVNGKDLDIHGPHLVSGKCGAFGRYPTLFCLGMSFQRSIPSRGRSSVTVPGDASVPTPAATAKTALTEIYVREHSLFFFINPGSHYMTFASPSASSRSQPIRATWVGPVKCTCVPEMLIRHVTAIKEAHCGTCKTQQIGPSRADDMQRLFLR